MTGQRFRQVIMSLCRHNASATHHDARFRRPDVYRRQGAAHGVDRSQGGHSRLTNHLTDPTESPGDDRPATGCKGGRDTVVVELLERATTSITGNWPPGNSTAPHGHLAQTTYYDKTTAWRKKLGYRRQVARLCLSASSTASTIPPAQSHSC